MYQRLLNKEIKPDRLEMSEYCYPQSSNFDCFNHYLRNHFATSQEIRFPYGHQYGWSICHRKGQKLVCDVFPEEGAFTVMFRLTTEQMAELSPQVNEQTQARLREHYQCGNGGWLHYRVTEDEQLQQLKILFEGKLKKTRL